jgi:metallophosphoesterase (TIGR00282 family)
MAMTSILFVGDIVGGIGRRTLLALLPGLREELSPTFVVVNGENSAGGLGITPQIARELLDNGVDAITLGNHAYHRREILPFLDEEPRIIRPANYLKRHPGSGVTTVERDGVTLGVVNLSGTVFLDAARSPFDEIESILSTLEDRVDHILVDFHAEATSEKVAFGWYLDGRVTAVVGTHTHVPTADARVLPGGTAYVSDVGMTGPRDSVIGVKKELAIATFVEQMKRRFETAEGDPWLMGAFVRCGPQRLRAASIEAVRVPWDGRGHSGG